MVIINREERDAIAKKFPDVTIVRTMKSDSKRGHYYLEERRDAMKFLREFRNRNVIEEYPPRPRRNKKKYFNKKNGRACDVSRNTKK